MPPHFAKNSTPVWKNCRPTWRTGSPSTIGHARTRASTVMARLRCRLSWIRFLWRERRCLPQVFPPCRSRSGALRSAAQAEARSRVPPLDQPMRQIKSELLQFIRLTHPFSVKPEYLSKEHSIYAIVIAQSRLCGIQINSRHQNKLIPNNGGLPALSLDADSTWQKSLYGRNGTSRCLRRLLFVSVLPATVVGLWTMVHRTQQCRSPVVQKRSYEAQYLNFPLQRRLFNFFLP
jgi:hypothetical protein